MPDVSTTVWEKGLRLANDGRVRPVSGWQVGGYLVTQVTGMYTEAHAEHHRGPLWQKPQPCPDCLACSCPATTTCSHVVAVLLLLARGEL